MLITFICPVGKDRNKLKRGLGWSQRTQLLYYYYIIRKPKIKLKGRHFTFARDIFNSSGEIFSQEDTFLHKAYQLLQLNFVLLCNLKSHAEIFYLYGVDTYFSVGDCSKLARSTHSSRDWYSWQSGRFQRHTTVDLIMSSFDQNNDLSYLLQGYREQQNKIITYCSLQIVKNFRSAGRPKYFWIASASNLSST